MSEDAWLWIGLLWIGLLWIGFMGMAIGSIVILFQMDHHPHRPGAAAAPAAGIVVPSALACLAALSVAWTGFAGLLGTEAVVTWALRLVAAPTVPHMALDWIARRRPA